MSNYYNRQWRLPNNENKDKQSNYSMDFDGSSQYVDTNYSELNGTSTFTLSLWAKTSDTSRDQFLFGNRGNQGVAFQTFTGNVSWLYLNPAYFYFSNSGNNISNDTWFNLVLVYDGSQTSNSDKLKLYINGTSVNYSGNLTGNFPTTMPTSTENFMIGRDPLSNSEWLGFIDAVSIFDYALSSSQITTLYGSSSTGIGNPMSLSPAPVAYYPLGDQDSFNGAEYLVPNIAAEEADGDIATSYSPYALDFDGTNDYIDCGAISVIPSATQITVSFWANTDSTSQSQVVFGDNSSSPIFSFEYWGSSNKMFFEYGTGTYAYLTLTSVVTAGSWDNVVLVYNASGASNTDKIKIYVDGVDKSSLLTYVGTIPTSLNASIGNFWIGNGQNYNSPFNGKLSNFSIWNTNLSSTQVSEIYSEGVPSNLNNHSAYSNLVSWWQLGSNSSFNTNWTVLDEKGSNNGTSVNMTEDDIVDGVGSYANGLSNSMGGDEIIGSAPFSDANSLSINMDVLDRTDDTPS